jgi:MFS family permease
MNLPTTQLLFFPKIYISISLKINGISIFVIKDVEMRAKATCLHLLSLIFFSFSPTKRNEIMKAINADRLFTASCMALVVTSMTFAIRAGMLKQLGIDFGLNDSELGWIAGMAFLGFPLATTLGGLFVDAVGMKPLIWLTFAAHVLGLILTVVAGGFWTLMISTFLIGFANGMTEAVCNPLIASMYTDNKTTMLNKFHVWFPGGIVVGSLLSAAMTSMHLGWQLQVAIILIPALIYAYLFWGEEFPETERVASGVSMSEMLTACTSPMFLLMAAAMFLTANTELSTTQWVEKLLGGAGANPMLILALVTGLMAVGRYFGGPLIHKLNPLGVLLLSSIVSVLGLFLLQHATGAAVYGAAVVFALGVCYFWPTMLGYVSETMPKTGAMGLSLMGGAGMFGNWAYQTFLIGPKLDQYKAAAAASGITDPAKLELIAGQHVLSNINILPVILVGIFGALYFFKK